MIGGSVRDRVQGFVAQCRAAGLAVTPQRLAIFRHLAAMESHPSAEELHATVRRELPTLSLATVYKTLDTLAGVGAVRPVSRLGARGRWDANVTSHHHLVCTVCGRVTDVVEPRLDAASRPAAKVAARHGFSVAGHAIEIFGTCAACRGGRRGARAYDIVPARRQGEEAGTAPRDGTHQRRRR